MLSKLVGINHVALEVDSIDEALEFYGRFFELHLRGLAPGMAFIDLGDQFLALSERREQSPDEGRHLASAAALWQLPRARGGGVRCP